SLKVILIGLAQLHSHQIVSCWRQHQVIGQSGYGIQQLGRSYRSLKAILVQLLRLHSHQAVICCVSIRGYNCQAMKSVTQLNHTSLSYIFNLYVKGGPGSTSEFIVPCIVSRMCKKLLEDSMTKSLYDVTGVENMKPVQAIIVISKFQFSLDCQQLFLYLFKLATC